MWYTVLNVEKSAAGEMNSQVQVSRNSSRFAGHFPEDPILPGIFQICMVMDCIAEIDGRRMCPAGLRRVKFKKIVRPGEILDIHASYDNKRNRYIFQVSSGSEEVCSGMLSCRDDSPLTG